MNVMKKLLDDYASLCFQNGIEVANKEWVIKATEVQRQNMVKRIFFPYCWLFGHKIDPLWRFCSRCKIAEEKLMS